MPPFAKAQTELTSCKVGWLPFDQHCGKQSELFKPEQITNWREGAQCWGLGFFFPSRIWTLYLTLSHLSLLLLLGIPLLSCRQSESFLRNEAKRLSRQRDPWLAISAGPSAKRSPGQQGVKLLERAGALALVPQL